jgi:hypothetical protein
MRSPLVYSAQAGPNVPGIATHKAGDFFSVPHSCGKVKEFTLVVV